ncbi:NlpC/P60 family protein [Jannaschia pohangensis]|uniref:Putative phage cell wall peptidase, NlpC/P60 family n=1 Tax=Jannaschia pohangensis TaxID=390807 RepID=A0A1I3HR80_9RHOB|nr:NlpC/P60 family protein [Jannaschia pohangensis]SFI38254.1 putative phage cell wall peptidase, NlpC/P60 family [Jannaschia pohangensis]
MSRVVDVARAWIGTPYMHQGAVKGAGTDCLGLIRGVWREVYGEEPEAVPQYSEDWAEVQGLEVLDHAAGRHLRRLPVGEALAPGQLLLFRMRNAAIAKHLGIVTTVGPHPRFVHAYSGHGVVESSLSHPWMRRVAARFEFPAHSH